MQENELEIIRTIKKGNRKAFEFIFKKYYRFLLAYAKKFVLEEEVAEDIIQNVFFNLWEKRAEIDFSKPIKPYLFRAVHNFSVNYLKSLKQKENYRTFTQLRLMESQRYDSSSENSTSRSLIIDEIQEHLEQALEELPERCRQVFSLSRFEGQKNTEIADELEISVKAVEKQISKALSLLRDRLKEYLHFFIL